MQKKKGLDPDIRRMQALILGLVGLTVGYDAWIIASGEASERNPPIVILPLALLAFLGCMRYAFGREHPPMPRPLPKEVLDDAWERSGVNPKDTRRQDSDIL